MSVREEIPATGSRWRCLDHGYYHKVVEVRGVTMAKDILVIADVETGRKSKCANGSFQKHYRPIDQKTDVELLVEAVREMLESREYLNTDDMLNERRGVGPDRWSISYESAEALKLLVEQRFAEVAAHGLQPPSDSNDTGAEGHE